VLAAFWEQFNKEHFAPHRCGPFHRDKRLLLSRDTEACRGKRRWWLNRWIGGCKIAKSVVVAEGCNQPDKGGWA
jgi:hypothetical protein